jgi:hypothetical protein
LAALRKGRPTPVAKTAEIYVVALATQLALRPRHNRGPQAIGLIEFDDGSKVTLAKSVLWNFA